MQNHNKIDMPYQFSVITYNLGYGFTEPIARVKNVIEQIKNINCDVAAFQEASTDVYNTLFREMRLLGYKRFIPKIMSVKNTGEVIFSKIHILETKYIPFQYSQQNRGLTCIRVLLGEEDKDDVDDEDIEDETRLPPSNNSSVWIVTSQFETGDKGPVNIKKQIKCFESAFRDEVCVVFAGDTQLKPYSHIEFPPNNKQSLVVWKDSWYEAGKGEGDKYTYDSATNRLCPRPHRDRPDIVCYRNDMIECDDHRLLGIENADIHASSHYGVYAHFTFLL